MDKDLEILTLAGVGGAFGRSKRAAHAPLEPGTRCPNCDHELTGRYCAQCGQPSDLHHRSIGHLVWEGIESLLHLDGRLARTVPALFVRPGTLGRDYLEGRIARHVPPFRMFLVALLIFIVSAEHDVDAARNAAVAEQARREAVPVTPAARAAAADKARREAASDYADDAADAAKDRDASLAQPDERDRAIPRYQEAMANIAAARVRALAHADDVAAGKAPPEDHDVLFASEEERHAAAERQRAEAKARGGLNRAIRLAVAKAVENPEYYLSTLFEWAHRLVMLLLPVVAGFLALLYVFNKKYYVYDHLITAMNFLSFLFLANAAAFWLPWPAQTYALLAILALAPVNLAFTLRGAYGSSILGSVLKSAIVWVGTVFSFVILVVTLVSFVLFQL